MQDFLKIAEQACRESGKIQLENLSNEKEIEFKGAINLVTSVDKVCEKFIVELIQGNFPDHDILAEEGGGKRKDSPYKWVIDPLDGTTNYAHRYPLFCTSIALEYQGEIIAAAVYEPNRDEMFLAEKGSGATCNGKKIAVSSHSTVNESMLATGFAYNIRETEDNNLNHFKNVVLSAQAVRRDGVAASDLCDVAMGRYDGFWELNLFPWDVAAGFLIVQESGGKVSDFRGKNFEIYSKQILATNDKIHQEMVDILMREL